MNEMTRKEKIDRLSLYKKNKIYTYIKDMFGWFCNGYILKIDNKKIIFKDDKVKLPVPIDIDVIRIIVPSKKIKEDKE